jgi:uncharacterized protein YbjT (DUF2867 family)
VILVTAGHGTQARRLIPRLARAGVAVRAIRRRPGAQEPVRALGATEVMAGDLCDPAVMSRAMEGVSAVYHVGPTAHPREAPMGIAAVDAAVAAGVGHFVYASVLHARIGALVQHREKQRVEEHLVSCAIPFTILQPADFMETLNHKRAFRDGVFRLIWALERRQSLVSVADVADVACAVLTEGERHHGATYELSAPGCFSAHDIAAAIGRVSGRPVTAELLEVEAVLSLYAHDEFGAEGHAYRRRFFDALVSWYGAHDFVGNPQVLTMLLGRSPTTLEAFLDEQFRAWRNASQG